MELGTHCPTLLELIQQETEGTRPAARTSIPERSSFWISNSGSRQWFIPGQMNVGHSEAGTLASAGKPWFPRRPADTRLSLVPQSPARACRGHSRFAEAPRGSACRYESISLIRKRRQRPRKFHVCDYESFFLEALKMCRAPLEPGCNCWQVCNVTDSRGL